MDTGGVRPELVLNAYRRDTLRRLRRWFDCSDEQFAEVIEAISAEGSPRRRIETALNWRRSSAAVFFDELPERLASEEGFQLEELLPGSTEGLARYLRLESSQLEDWRPDERLDDAARTLVSEEGVEVAVRRLAGLPVPLPIPTMEAVARLSPEEREALLGGLLRAPGSPVSALHMVRLLLRFRQDRPSRYPRIAKLILRRLLSEQGETTCDAYLSVLRWVNAHRSRWPETRSWPPAVRLAVEWSLTHNIWSALLAAGAPPDWSKDTFAKAQVSLPLDIFARNPGYRDDVAHPRRANPAVLLLTGASYALGEDANSTLDDGLRSLIRSHAQQQSGEVEGPALPLLRDPTLLPNALGSYLGEDRGRTWSRLLGPSSEDDSGRTRLLRVATEAVEKIADLSLAPADRVNGWLGLHTVIGDSPPYEELREQLVAAISSTDFSDLCRHNLISGTFALFVASQYLASLNSGELREHLEEQTSRVARVLAEAVADAHPPAITEDTDAGRAALHVLEAVLHIALAAGTESRPEPKAFSELARRVVDTCPATASIYHSRVQSLCEELPLEQSRYLCPLLLRLRAA